MCGASARSPSRSCSQSIRLRARQRCPTIRLVKRALTVPALVTACRRVGGVRFAAARRENADAATSRGFYVPIKPTARGNLLCNIKTSSYSRAQQNGCQSRAGLDWHGFQLSIAARHSRPAPVAPCTTSAATRPPSSSSATAEPGTPTGSACTSRVAAGLTCTNGHGHGLVLSRESYRLY